MRAGYILLEIIIAISIASIFLLGMLNSLSQINIAFGLADRTSGIDMRAALFHHQFERDISGVFVPFVTKEKGIEEKTEEPGKEKKTLEKKDVPLQNSFHSTNKKGLFDFLTFITSNPLIIYNKVSSRIARVIYKLEEDRESEKMWGKGKKSYKLFRQESFNLDFVSIDSGTKKRATKFELIDNIKNFVVEYSVAAVKKTDGKDTKGIVEYKNFKAWGKPEVDQTKKQRPDFCTVKVDFWDEKKQRFFYFEFKFYLLHTQEIHESK